MTGTLEFTVESIAAGGDGVGRANGMVVFAPRTAPGDRVRATVQRARRFARTTRVELLDASAQRVAPECIHYERDRCGGCQLQHLALPAQREAKAGIVRDALQRIARRTVEVPAVRFVGDAWRYRSKLTLSLRRQDGEWLAGLHRYDAPDEIFRLDDCRIADERVMATWRDVLRHDALLPSGNELRASVRWLRDSAALVVEGGAQWSEAQALLDAVPPLSEVWWKADRPSAPRRLVAHRGDTAGGASFTQVNPAVADLLRTHVLSLVRAHAPGTVVDAYSGAGDTAEPIARGGARVVAIEVDRDASGICAARLPAGSRAVTDTVERALPSALPADLVILNPPRAGTDAAVTTALERPDTQPSVILYVSCDPATLARDLTRLPSYRIASIAAFDMFPQTAHVETVCELVREVAA